MATYKVTLIVDLKSPVAAEELSAYIADAVETWDGSLRPPGGYDDNDPGDPMFANVAEVSVATVVRKRKKRTMPDVKHAPES